MKSEKVELLVKALIKAKGSFGVVLKSKTNPFFSSKYADLADIEDAVRASLDSNGLLVVQTTEVVGTATVLVTTLYHESGQFVSGQYPLNPVKNDPQGLGSATTYARRYALSALLGVVADADDDGNAASHKPNESAKQSAPSRPQAGTGDSAEIHKKVFVPAGLSKKDGEKNGKSWTMYSIKDPEGAYYTTFDEAINELAHEAKAAGEPLEFSYVLKGTYKNLVSVEKAVEVPF